MAFGASTIWDVRTTGSDTSNGGGFNPANANMATDLAATSGTGTAPVVSSASYTFVAGDVGHWVYVKSGTNWNPGWYQIDSVAAGAATLNATAGSYYAAENPSSGYYLPVTSTVNGCATVASPSSGTWTIDYSQGASPSFAFTDLVIDGATNTDFTSALNPIGKNMVGNIIVITGGSGFTTQRVEVVSIPSGVIGRADKSMGTLGSTGGTGALGGCLASPGKAAGLVVSGGQNAIFVKNGTYSCSSSSNVADGKLVFSAVRCYLVGWNTNRTIHNTDATRPQFNATSNSMIIVSMTINSIPQLIANIVFSGNGQTGVTCVEAGQNVLVRQCKATTAATCFSAPSTGAHFYQCEATAWTTNGWDIANSSSSTVCIGCYAHDGTGTAFRVGSSAPGCHFVYCIADTITTGDGFASSSTSNFVNCVAYNCASLTKSGFWINGSVMQAVFFNCISHSNTVGFTIGASASPTTSQFVNCAIYNNTTNFDSYSNYTINKFGLITLTGDPFTSAAGADFSLNNTAGAGAACRGVGFPTTLPGASTNNYLDVGMAQVQLSTAGALMYHPGMGGGVEG